MRYSGHKETARIVAQISAGKKLAAVHKARPKIAKARTILAFIRARAPKGSGFFTVLANSSPTFSDDFSLAVLVATLAAIPLDPVVHDRTSERQFIPDGKKLQ